MCLLEITVLEIQARIRRRVPFRSSHGSKSLLLANGYGSVCIISIIRLVVLSRLAAVDVTCMYNHLGLTGLS